MTMIMTCWLNGPSRDSLASHPIAHEVPVRPCVSLRMGRPVPPEMHASLLSKSLACMKQFKAQVGPVA